MQSPLPRHCTQVSVLVSHWAVVPMHALVLPVVHCTHCPVKVPAVSHAGLAPLQSPSTQARQTSSCAAVADLPQIGVAPEQCESLAHATQVPYLTLVLSVSQCGVAPVQLMPSSAAVQTRQPAGVPAPVQIGGSVALVTMQAF